MSKINKNTNVNLCNYFTSTISVGENEKIDTYFNKQLPSDALEVETAQSEWEPAYINYRRAVKRNSKQDCENSPSDFLLKLLGLWDCEVKASKPEPGNDLSESIKKLDDENEKLIVTLHRIEASKPAESSKDLITPQRLFNPLIMKSSNQYFSRNTQIKLFIFLLKYFMF